MSIHPEQLTHQTREAISAIYSDAYSRGHRAGFSSGVAEKIWLHKSWPMITVFLCAVSLITGILIMGTQL